MSFATDDLVLDDAPTTQSYAGFVALIGAPNAGKSTLLNNLIGQKVSIVSRKVQTTRTQIRGILSHNNTQVIFVDTPGIFRPKKRLERSMVSSAWDGAGSADHVVLLIDAQKGLEAQETQDIIEGLQKADYKVDIALNKIDCVKKEKLLELAQQLQDTGIMSDLFMISALNGYGTEKLKQHLLTKVPESPFLYDPEDISDLPIKLLAAEITREQIYDQLHDELPYNATVETEIMKKTKSGTKTPLNIEQTIFVTREAHKRILLGKKGQKIRTIGQRARIELGKLLERPVNLFLFVKVRENWQDDKERYDVWGLDFK